MTMLKTPALGELELFDGKNTRILEPILSRFTQVQALIEDLVLLVTSEEPNIQIGATWLLKRLAENNVPFETDGLIALFGSVAELTRWESKLHICQMLRYVVIPQQSLRSIAWFLERNLDDDNKFLRAWSYSGLYELARQYEEYFDYAREQIERGEADKAASVKARIRNIRKAMNKLAGKPPLSGG